MLRVAWDIAKLSIGTVLTGSDVNVGTVLTVAFPVAAVAVGLSVYLDAIRRGREEFAPFLGFIVGGLFLVGSVPGLVALAITDEAATQGFPTALRVVPGMIALGIYIYFR